MAMIARRGGFWIRLASFAIDFALLCASVCFLRFMVVRIGVYVPLDAIFLILLVLYNTVLIGWKGATLGKSICGLEVCTSQGGTIGYGRAFIRESIAKCVSAILFMLGYLWILLPGPKRGWHDYMARTVVVRTDPRPRHARLGMAAGLGLAVTAVIAVAWQPLWIYVESHHLSPSGGARPPYMDRDAKDLIEISELMPEDEARMARWLRVNGQDPVDYVVQVAQAHDVTILGEVHFVRENLEFLNRLLPRLYHEAGVTCVAMECINAGDNDRAERIVTGQELRRDLILELAQRHNWKSWGWREYWDVLESVWQLNRGLPPGAEPMRVVGLMPELDLPSFALSGISDGYRRSAHVPVWERLRLARAFANLPVALLADHAYARNIEREILDKGERGIVLVGAAHAPLAHRQPSSSGSRESARMGFMLHEQYGGRLAHVLLHNTNSAGESTAQVIEDVTAAAGRSAVGFALEGSPLGVLRDRDSFPFSRQPGACLVDLADGYVLLEPTSELQHCTWMDGYVSKQMFAEYKPFYEMLVDQKLLDHEEANRAISATNSAP